MRIPVTCPVCDRRLFRRLPGTVPPAHLDLRSGLTCRVNEWLRIGVPRNHLRRRAVGKLNQTTAPQPGR